MKQLIRTKYTDISLVKALMFGIGYSDGEIGIVIGPILIEIKTYMFNRKPKKQTTRGVEI